MVDPHLFQNLENLFSRNQTVIIVCEGTKPLRELTGTMWLSQNPMLVINDFSGWSNATNEKPFKPEPNRLAKAFAKYLSETEIELLRAWNRQPTADGVAACVNRDRFSARHLNDPGLRARYDRRIPCWRSTRFKSLT